MKYPGYGDAAFDWLFLPAELGGGYTAPVGDYAYFSQSNGAGFRAIQYGARWDYGDYAGPFCYNLQRSATYTNRDLCCRLLYVP